MIDTKPGSIEEADLELGPLQEMTPAQNRAALLQARLVLSYLCVNLWHACEPGSVGSVLSKVALIYLERLPLLAALAVMEDRLDVAGE
jgi:hypothetical protein